MFQRTRRWKEENKLFPLLYSMAVNPFLFSSSSFQKQFTVQNISHGIQINLFRACLPLEKVQKRKKLKCTVNSCIVTHFSLWSGLSFTWLTKLEPKSRLSWWWSLFCGESSGQTGAPRVCGGSGSEFADVLGSCSKLKPHSDNSHQQIATKTRLCCFTPSSGTKPAPFGPTSVF